MGFYLLIKANEACCLISLFFFFLKHFAYRTSGNLELKSPNLTNSWFLRSAWACFWVCMSDSSLATEANCHHILIQILPNLTSEHKWDPSPSDLQVCFLPITIKNLNAMIKHFCEIAQKKMLGKKKRTEKQQFVHVRARLLTLQPFVIRKLLNTGKSGNLI